MRVSHLLRPLFGAVIATGLLAGTLGAGSAAAQTPESTGAGCSGVVATPAAGQGMMGHGHGGHGTAMATPGTGQMHVAEYDLMYIDMMIPHHESIIALATVARDELTHPRLIEIANQIVATQQGEIDELRQLRDQWYPGAAPVSMEMMAGMPGLGGNMTMMDQQMSGEWQVQTFCAATDKDLAFIDQVIPHHQMAIDTSVAAVELAVHPELAEIARNVITAQQGEIDELEQIRAEITGQATPAA